MTWTTSHIGTGDHIVYCYLTYSALSDNVINSCIFHLRHNRAVLSLYFSVKTKIRFVRRRAALSLRKFYCFLSVISLLHKVLRIEEILAKWFSSKATRHPNTEVIF